MLVQYTIYSVLRPKQRGSRQIILTILLQSVSSYSQTTSQ